jgi:hypothetical protein
MVVFVVALIAILAMAVGIGAMVMMGMQGYFRDRHPGAARTFSGLARHLNGDAAMPETLEQMLRKRSSSH